MKKLLIVSLFLLSMIGLMAQGTPYNLQFFITDSAGEIHPTDTFGYKCVQYNAGFGGEMWAAPNPVMYWNYPGEADQNTGETNYNPANGQLVIQMAPMANWGVFGTTVRFWFIDSFGTETGPIEVAKLPGIVDGDVYPDVVAWGQIPNVGPTPPDAWATYLFPANGATGVGINDADMDMNYPNLGWNYDGTVDPDGFEVWVDDVHVDDVAFNAEDTMFGYIHPADLAYETTYTWGVKPYIEPVAKRGMKASKNEPERLYPTEGAMDEWTFTTKAEPVVINPPDAWATVGTPADEAPAVAIDAQLTWTYDGTVAPDGYELIWNGGEAMDLGNVLTYDPGTLDYNTGYTWSIKPYVNNEAKKGFTKGLKKALRNEPEAKLYPEGDMPVWSFTTTNQVPSGSVVIIVPDGVTNPNPPVDNPDPVITDIPVIPASLEYIAVTINQPIAGLYGITFTLPQAYGSMRVLLGGIALLLDNPDVDGQYYEVNGLEVTVWVLFAGGAKEEKDIVIVDDSTLPVTLSSFTAQAHANEYVTLKWVTESESNLQGYNVYRAETDNQDQAIRINPTVVAANNQTQTQTYTYTDNEVEATTYYYWLEVAELANENSFHGPIVVTVEDDPVVPGITETVFRNFGPSPFTESTSTTLRVKEGETATVTIYNLLGQVVSRESFNAGEHNFEFNGRDLNNKKVANGIYFVRMSSPTQTKNFKIVKIK